MYKPILIERTLHYTWKIGDIVKVFGSKLEIEPDWNVFNASIKKERQCACDIIIIDTEAEIVEGDWVYDKHEKPDEIYKITSKPSFDTINRFKIISSTQELNVFHKCNEYNCGKGKCHCYTDFLPQLSPQSIQLLINYYNEYNCMSESVKVRDIIAPIYGNNGSVYPITYVPKLNQQGEVDITIPEVKCDIDKTLKALNKSSNKLISKTKIWENLYTEEEVIELCSMLWSDTFSTETFWEWFELNKKK